MKSASKALSSSNPNPDTGVYSKTSGSRAPVRSASSGFSGFSADVKKASWDELARGRESDGETKNYNVPPELIALARATRKGRGEVGTLTPLAPKPVQEVVVVVPAPAPVAQVEAPAPSFSPDLSSVPPDSDVQPVASVPVLPDSASHERAIARAEAVATPAAVPVPPPLPVMTSEEPVSAEASQGDAAKHESVRPELEQSQTRRRSSRRGRRSSHIELPPAAIEAAQAEARMFAAPSRLRRHGPFLRGAVIVGAYVVLCYYANALLASWP